eukprot:684916-Amorphochlora_amoeboformis.AAC.1
MLAAVMLRDAGLSLIEGIPDALADSQGSHDRCCFLLGSGNMWYPRSRRNTELEDRISIQ